MKKTLNIITLFIGLQVWCQPQTRNVLFIGNSYTEVNNLPQIIANVAASAGDVLTYDSHTPGGYTLLQHSTNTTTRNKIAIGNWDYVVVQGQSQEAILDEFNFSVGARNLYNTIKQYNPCATPIFYVTWGRKNGDQINCPNFPVTCSYETMDNAIKQNYFTMAEFLRTEVSPVSLVWKYLRQNYPSIELYQTDESHPSEAGSYAAACCFYTTLFKKDPTLITYNYNLSPANAAIIRNATKITVFDYLNSWDFEELPISNFNYSIGTNDNQVLFDNQMQNADTFHWDFGDGTTNTTTISPTHIYANNGTYTVTLTVNNCDNEGSHQSTHSVTIAFCSHTPTLSEDMLWVCYEGSSELWTQTADSYQWYDNGIPLPGENNQSLIVTISSSGNLSARYPSVLSTVNGCSEMSKRSEVKMHVWDEFGPIIHSINIDGNIINQNQVCKGEALTLNLQFPPAHSPQWYKDDVAIPAATGDLLAVTESGTYKVKVSHPSCTSMDFFSESYQFEFINCPLSIDEPITVALDPSDNILNIKLKYPIEEISIYNMQSCNVISSKNSNAFIDVTHLSQGVYIVKVRTQNDKTFSAKFVKQH